MRALLLVAVAFVTGAFGLPSPATASPSASVTIVDFAFSPFEVHVDFNGLSGNSVTFTNTGVFAHRPHDDEHGTVLGVGEGECFDTGTLFSGQVRTVTISPACAVVYGGIIDYHCHLHPGMHGTIVVDGITTG